MNSILNGLKRKTHGEQTPNPTCILFGGEIKIKWTSREEPREEHKMRDWQDYTDDKEEFRPICVRTVLDPSINYTNNEMPLPMLCSASIRHKVGRVCGYLFVIRWNRIDRVYVLLKLKYSRLLLGNSWHTFKELFGTTFWELVDEFDQIVDCVDFQVARFHTHRAMEIVVIW